MQKHIITLLCATGLAISVPASAAALKVRPDAPVRYTVKPGDTLWRISGKYLYSPWQWNRLWGVNRKAVRNPHWIYPGQELVLRYVNGKPRLGYARGARPAGGGQYIKLRPHQRETSSGYGIRTVDIDMYKLSMQHPHVISSAEIAQAPQLVAGPEDRVLYTQGDRVYGYRVPGPGKYLVYRVNKKIVDPETRKYLGEEVVFSGIVSTLPGTNSAMYDRSPEEVAKLPRNEYYTPVYPVRGLPAVSFNMPAESATPMMVEEAVSEIRKGDRLLKLTDEQDSFNMMPHAPVTHVDARVISLYDGISQSGQFRTVTLNRGTADGLDKGTVLSVYKRSRQLKFNPKDLSDKSSSSLKYVSIPAEEAGLVMVYRVSEHLSSAIVLESTIDITIGDTVTEPGHDLDNMADEDLLDTLEDEGGYAVSDIAK